MTPTHAQTRGGLIARSCDLADRNSVGQVTDGRLTAGQAGVGG